MRVLFSWIAMKEDLVKSRKTGMISGPTLQLLFDKDFDVLHLFSSDKKSMEKASKFKSYVEENKKNTLEFKGWETKDAYSNRVSFSIMNIITNKTIDDEFFKIPKEEDL